MRILKISLALASVLLVACEQAQVHGPVGGGTVSIEELRTGVQVLNAGTVTDTEETAIQRYGSERWNDFNDLEQLMLLGFHQSNTQTQYDSNTWYLMQVSGGVDYDRNTDLQVDSPPSPVTGTVHAIVKGAKLNESGFTVSPLTEAVYQQVKDDVASLNDNQLEELLDDLAELVVNDVNDDGAVDYTDVLAWNAIANFLNPTLLVDYQSQLLPVADAIAAGVDTASAASGLFPAEQDPAEALFVSSVSDIVQSSCGIGCHYPGGGGSLSSLHDLTPTSNADHISLNIEMYRNLVQARGVEFIINKATRNGVSHGGGKALQDDDVEDFETFLNLL